MHVPKKGDAYVFVCARHKSSGAQSIKTILEYAYPGAQPVELQNLHPAAEGYLSPILVFCELTNSHSRLTQATSAGHHFVSGRIGLYKSPNYLGAHAGTLGLVSLSDIKTTMTDEDKQRVRDAWDWMKQNHPLISCLKIDEPSDLMNATENVVVYTRESSGRRNINVSGLRAYHMGPVGTGGPRTANELSNIDNLPIGVLGGDQQLVKYSNPCLLGYLFPTLYPEGRGFFSKDYDGIQSRTNQIIQYHDDAIDNHVIAQDNELDLNDEMAHPLAQSDDEEDRESEESEYEAEAYSAGNDESKYSKHTIKSYAKFCLLSPDRLWGCNIQKATIFGYQMRVTPAKTASRATRAHEIRERSNNSPRTKYRESRIVVIPPTIRTGAKYKALLYQKLSALFDEYGTPELFGTFTCNDRSDGQVSLAEHFAGPGASTHDDPVLFTMHWKRQWFRFWNWLVTSRKGHEG
ncbi:hypothetical protein BG004_008209 [Podila humilis]|nr:hypothetical protein BG004_008209 [Podila humilis]